MLSAGWYYDWAYWNLGHKVTFDGVAKLILVNLGVTELDWEVDVYSAWKEWVKLPSHIGNAGFLPALRVIGGDNITTDGSRKVGATYFLTNGWRIKTWGGNHRLRISGNVYTEEGDPIYVPHDGPYNVIIEQTVSTLVETVEIQTTATGEIGEIPTASEVAEAVWGKMAISSVNAGTFGEYINMIKAVSESTANTMAVVNAKLDTASAVLDVLLKYESNRTQINQTEKTMTVYEDDGVTVMKVFDLKDFAGQPSITQVAERSPR